LEKKPKFMKMRHFFFEKKNLNKNFLFLLDCKMSFLKFGIYTKKNEKKPLTD
jgi:hypothetical protein